MEAGLKFLSLSSDRDFTDILIILMESVFSVGINITVYTYVYLGIIFSLRDYFLLRYNKPLIVPLKI